MSWRKRRATKVDARCCVQETDNKEFQEIIDCMSVRLSRLAVRSHERKIDEPGGNSAEIIPGSPGFGRQDFGGGSGAVPDK